MGIQTLIDWAHTFFVQYSVFCYVLGGIILLLILWKPAKVLKTTFLILILLIILYACFYLLGIMNLGIDVKDKAIYRTEKSIEE